MWPWSTAPEPEGGDTSLTPSALHVQFNFTLSSDETPHRAQYYKSALHLPEKKKQLIVNLCFVIMNQ